MRAPIEPELEAVRGTQLDAQHVVTGLRGSRPNLYPGLESGPHEDEGMMVVFLAPARHHRRDVPRRVSVWRNAVRDVTIEPEDDALRCRHCRGEPRGPGDFMTVANRGEIGRAAQLAHVEPRQRRAG